MAVIIWSSYDSNKSVRILQVLLDKGEKRTHRGPMTNSEKVGREKMATASLVVG